MDRKQAYDYFLKALTAQVLRVGEELDSCQVGSAQYAALSEKHARILAALVSLDDIANLV